MKLANIDAGERTKRRWIGVAGAVVATALVVWLFSTGASRWLRLLVALPIGVSLLGFFQATAGT